ncbi:MAG: MATE family efflux transporter, partial [Bacteroidales bacterium]
KNFQLKMYIIRNILAIGISPFLINLTAAVVTAIISSSLMRYGGDLAIGAYGIINSFAVLIVMIIIGLCQGMQPIVGFNYGAGKRERMREALVLGIKVATVVSILCFIVAEFFPKYVAMAFTNDPELTELSVHALRVVLVASPFIGFQIVITNFFQSIGKVKLSILLSLSRQVLFLIPMLFILPPLFELSGVWMAMPVADSISVIFAAVVLYRNRHIFRTSMGTLEGLN